MRRAHHGSQSNDPRNNPGCCPITKSKYSSFGNPYVGINEGQDEDIVWDIYRDKAISVK